MPWWHQRAVGGEGGGRRPVMRSGYYGRADPADGAT
jgi:hypothetical protein